MIFTAICLLLVASEVAWDWYQEIKKGKVPNYTGSNILRTVVGGAVWVSSPALTDITERQELFLPVPMAFGFWFLFDWWLNLARSWSGHPRPYWYLGENSKIDMWQRRNGGAFAWFWIKGLLFTISLVIQNHII